MPLPIGFDKTISQPFIVALMTDLLDSPATGGGSGDRYGPGLSGGSPCGTRASGLERRGRRGVRAPPRRFFGNWATSNVGIRVGDGFAAGPSMPPSTRSSSRRRPGTPQALLEQLKPGGRWFCRWGLLKQGLTVIDKDPAGGSRSANPFRFDSAGLKRSNEGGTEPARTPPPVVFNTR